MFENVNTPQTPPNQPAPKDPKDWGPWKPVDGTKKPAGPVPPPPLGEDLSGQPPVTPPTQNPNINVPNNVDVPGTVTTDLPEPNKRKFVLIGIIIFALLIVLIAGAIFALDYFSNTNENMNDVNSNEVTNSVVNTNNTNSDTNENVNTTINENLNSIFDVNTNVVNTNTETDLNSNANDNSNENVNTNKNVNTIINSALLDSDNDGLTDENEEIYGTDRINPDTDGDGYLDGDEIKNGYNPLCNPATAVEKGCNTKLL